MKAHKTHLLTRWVLWGGDYPMSDKPTKFKFWCLELVYSFECDLKHFWLDLGPVSMGFMFGSITNLVGLRICDGHFTISQCLTTGSITFEIESDLL
jgi:hypothetical protein